VDNLIDLRVKILNIYNEQRQLNYWGSQRNVQTVLKYERSELECSKISRMWEGNQSIR
jgi:hypothetical protein